MVLVDVLLAFALIMLGLATIVTVMVEIIHRVCSLRARGMQEILIRLFENTLLPALKEMDPESVRRVAVEKRQFVQQMICNPLLVEDQRAIESRFQTPETTRMGRLGMGLRRLQIGSQARWLGQSTDLDLLECLKRLPQTDVYRQLEEAGRAHLVTMLERIAERYDHYTASISEYFKARAQLLSLCMGVLLSIGGNIDGLRIFNSFIADPAKTAEVIASQAQLEAAYRDAMNNRERLDAAEAQSIQQIESRLDAVYQSMGNMHASGLPVGWLYFPGCVADESHSIDKLCRKHGSVNAHSPSQRGTAPFLDSLLFDRFAWVFRVVVTGLMIGLGGPFWFDVARRLAALRKGLSPSAQDSQNPPAQQAEKVQAQISRMTT